MFARLTASSSRTLVRRSFASLPPPSPPAPAARHGLALGVLSASIALGGFLASRNERPAVSLLASPLLLESPVSTPKSSEAPIPAQPPSTTSNPVEGESQIGQAPVVEGRASADRAAGSEFNDIDVAGEQVGGSAPAEGASEESPAGSPAAAGGSSSSKGTADPKTQGAFNEETGEINWDCPCLGGMPHGPCGEEFRAAFSCFVYSEEEPKGIECVEKFKGMQECFRAHPEVYGESDYEEDEAAEAAAAAVEAEQHALEPLETQLKEDPAQPFKGEDDERGELFAQDGGLTGEGIGAKTE